MAEFVSETDSEYTSYWRDWVGPISAFSITTSCCYFVSMVFRDCMDVNLGFHRTILNLLMDQALFSSASACRSSRTLSSKMIPISKVYFKPNQRLGRPEMDSS